MKKAVILFMTILLTVFMASAALAINQEARPETMFPDSDCDDAGTFKISFTAFDYPIVNNWLADNEFVWFRLLLGSGINPDVPFPTLCRAISGSQTHIGIGANGGNIPAPVDPGGTYAILDAVGVEVSDIDGDGPDVSAYVYGGNGKRYIDIYVTWLDQDVIPVTSGDEHPWIKIGLYEDLINTIGDGDPTNDNTDGATTLICAKVKGFFELDQLILSNDADPDTLTVNTADDRIGIFLDTPFTVGPCVVKEDTNYCDTETQIALCGDTQVGQNEFTCALYEHCFIISGDWPDRDELINFQVMTPTPGVSLVSIAWYNQGTTTSGPTLWQPFDPANSGTWSGIVPNELMPVQGYHVGPAATVWGYEYGPGTQCATSARSWIRWRAYSLDFSANSIRLCLSYNVNAAAVAGSTVQFTLSAREVPCGDLFEETVTGPLLVECGLGLQTCIYFPYVLFGYDGEFDDLGEYWATGIAVVNIGVGAVPADMQITYDLKDINGAAWTYTKTGYTQIMEVQTVDDMVAAYSWAPTGRCGWLKATGNFLIDGFQYNYVVTVDGMMFGAAVLPRQICTLFSALPNITPAGPIM